MDPATALQLVKNGVTLLLLDVPQYTLIGIDTQVFSAGPNFKGIKMIPPGVHFVYYSSSDREGIAFSTVVGFFIDACPSEVIVRKWDCKEERLVKFPEEEEERYANAVRGFEFDKQLGPYPLSQFRDWKHLSCYITKDAIERIEPVGEDITISGEAQTFGKFGGTASEEALAAQLKFSKFSAPEEKSERRGCFYTTIPRVVKHKGISSEELTSLNLDKTYLLEGVLMKEYRGDEVALLAELQFAFVAFLMGQSLEAFMQWKQLLNLLLGCAEAPLHTRTQLFSKVVEILYYQLKYAFRNNKNDSGGVSNGSSLLLDESWLSSDSFLYHLCKDFIWTMVEAPVIDGCLLSWTRKLQVLLEESLGWNVQPDGVMFEEGDEYAPVIENLDD